MPVEAPGTGLNTYAYFVAPSVASKFVALPDVTPAQVVAPMTRHSKQSSAGSRLRSRSLRPKRERSGASLSHGVACERGGCLLS